jgi:DNA invertase Pin-like site-specific DNA recombinase
MKGGKAMVVAAYLRVSTDAQAGADRYGLDAQRADITSYAHARGMEIGLWFEDAGFSGATLDRPGLSDLLSSASLHSFTTVIVAKLDRVARDLMLQLWIEKELLKAGVEIVSVSEPTNGSDPTSRLFREIIGAFAEFEKARITSRMSGGRVAKARQGGYAGGGAPLGYGAARGSHVLTVEPEQAKTVNQIFTLRAQGLPMRHIAAEMNARGLTTHEGKEWHAAQVKRVLDRKSLYCGEYSYGGIIAQGKHERILTG